MNKLTKRYVPFMKAGIQSLIVYRMNFLGFVIGGLIYCFVMFYLWKAVFDSNGSGLFMGFTMTDMVVYIFLSNITAQLTFSSVSGNVAEEIKDGSIAMRMIKPVNTDLSYLFTELGSALMKLVVLVLPMIVGLEIYRFCITGEVMLRAENLLLYLLSSVLAYTITFWMDLCFGFMAFYVKNLWGMSILKKSIVGFLSGSLIPLAFLPDILRNILEYLPFASMSYTPVMIYMGKYTPQQTAIMIGLQAVWALVIYGISKLIWVGAIKRLCVQGG